MEPITNILSFEQLLSGLVAGPLTFVIAKWVLPQLPDWDKLSQRTHFWSIAVLCTLLTGAGYAGQVVYGYAEFTPDGLVALATVAFTVSQALWGLFEASGATVAAQ